MTFVIRLVTFGGTFKMWYGSAVFFFVLGAIFFMLGMANDRMTDGIFAAGLMGLFTIICWVQGFMDGPSRSRVIPQEDQPFDSK